MIEKVFTIIVVNATSNDVAISYLKKKLNNLETCIQDGKFLQLRCIVHILNLIVTDGLKEMNELVAYVRGTIRYMRQSPARLAKFKECALVQKIQCNCLLYLDVSFKWNFTYLMLDSTQHQNFFANYAKWYKQWKYHEEKC